MTVPNPKLLADRQQVLIQDPVGQSYEIPDGSSEKLADFLWRGSVDSYCLQCEQKSVFKLQGPGHGYGSSASDEAKKLPESGVVVAHATCQRESKLCPGYLCGSKLYVCFVRDKDHVTKVGQYPSKADVDFGLLDPAFTSELPKEFRSEVGRAVGLRSHAVGVGAFVYLRRVFEALLEEARMKAEKDPDWDGKNYPARVRERIVFLAKHLPSRLVECADLYSLLSKGIHELTESECLDSFDVVFQGIQLILSQRREDKAYEAIAKKVRAAVSKHSGAP